MESGVVDVHRLMVRPEHFRKGIARSLTEHLEDTETPLSRIGASTGSINFPARSLYRRPGFAEKRKAEVARRLRVTPFGKVVRDDALCRVWP